MHFASTPLRPLDLHGTHAPARTHLLPSDMAGILTHGRHGKHGPSSLIHPDRPDQPHTPNTPHDEQIIDQARKWVAQTFFGTLLKQMRNSPFKSPLFEGGRGGQAFGELYDQKLIDHMSHGVGNKLTMAIARAIANPKKKGVAAEAGAAYARHSTLSPAANLARGQNGGASPGNKGDSRPSSQKRRTPASASESNFQKARAHVAAGL